MWHRIKEIGKDLLMIVMALAAICLLAIALNGNITNVHDAAAFLLSPLRAAPTQEDLPLVQTRSHVTEAARPLAITMMTSSGRASCHYDAARVDSAYLLFGPLLGEALDTASEGTYVSRDAYRAALGSSGVAFLYDLELPAGTLAAWLGADSAVEAAADQFLLAVEHGRIALYLCGSTGCLRYNTRTRADALTAQLETFLPDGTAFAFETQDTACTALHPMTLLDFSATAHKPELTIPGASLAAQAATRLGLNAFGSAAYTDADGAIVYNETGFSLRYAPDGTLLLTNQLVGDARFSALTLTTRIELVRAMLEAFTAGFSGDASLQLSAWEDDGERRILTFDYWVDGIPVLLPEGAAEAIFEGERLVQLRLTARCYTLTSETLGILPIRQAAAIVSPGQMLGLYYAEGAEMTAGWIAS